MKINIIQNASSVLLKLREDGIRVHYKHSHQCFYIDGQPFRYNSVNELLEYCLNELKYSKNYDSFYVPYLLGSKE